MKLDTLLLAMVLALGVGSSVRVLFEPFRRRTYCNTVHSHNPADLDKSAALVSALEALNQSAQSLGELNVS